MELSGSFRSRLSLKQPRAALWLLIPVFLAAPGRALAATEVELLTMGVGEHLYTRFGHSALRVRTDDGRDIVYNFGYSNFDAPDLIWRFLRGTALFWLHAQTYSATFSGYVRDDRSIVRQRLHLSPNQHAELAALLAWNALPQNRNYAYHHFRDNCATRPRDLVDRVSRGELRRQLVARPSGLRLRALVHHGFTGKLGTLLLADLVLGRLVDRPISIWEACFLPRILMEALPTTHGPDGRPLASPPELLYSRRQPSPLRGDPRSGDRLLWGVALLMLVLSASLPLLSRRSPRAAGAFLLVLVLPLGLTGLLVFGLALITPLPELRWNENLLHLWPTDLLLVGVAIRWLRRRAVAGNVLRAYANLRLAVALAALLGQAVGWLVQRPLSFLLMSLAFAAGLRLACHGLPRQRPVAVTPALLRSPPG